VSAKGASSKLNVTCPDCGSDLVVDVATGDVLFHKKPKGPLAGGKDVDSLFADMDSHRSRAEELFEREKAAHKDRSRLLEEKFDEAFRRASEDDDDTPPVRPFDLD
jgi:hypothetical protein